MLWDSRRRYERKVGVIAFPVFDPVHHQPLWLVVARRKNQFPWYLLTSEMILTPNDAWRIVLDYARRCQAGYGRLLPQSDCLAGVLPAGLTENAFQHSYGRKFCLRAFSLCIANNTFDRPL